MQNNDQPLAVITPVPICIHCKYHTFLHTTTYSCIRYNKMPAYLGPLTLTGSRLLHFNPHFCQRKLLITEVFRPLWCQQQSTTDSHCPPAPHTHTLIAIAHTITMETTITSFIGEDGKWNRVLTLRNFTQSHIQHTHTHAEMTIVYHASPSPHTSHILHMHIWRHIVEY